MSIPGFIVRILAKDGSTAGTGFVVDGNLIATCSHVAEKARSDVHDPIEVEFYPCKEHRWAWVVPHMHTRADAEDVTILELRASLPECVEIATLGSSAFAQGSTFRTFGFPAAQTVDGLLSECYVVGEVEQGGHPALQLRSHETTFGYSGAPIWNAKSNVVIGIVFSIVGTRGGPDHHEPYDPGWRQTETCFARPVEVARHLCPRLHIRNECPFRGLDAFRTIDAHLYFGRKRDSAALLGMLERSSFVAVIGLSGSGKSSLLRAGLEQVLNSSVLDLPSRSRILLKPSVNMHLDLILSVARAQGKSVEEIVPVAVDVDDYGMRDYEILTRISKYVVNLTPEAFSKLIVNAIGSRSILIIDQFERLYTETDDILRQDHFISTILALASDRVKVVLAIRADFYGKMLENRELAERLRDGFLQLSAMREQDIRRLSKDLCVFLEA